MLDKPLGVLKVQFLEQSNREPHQYAEKIAWIVAVVD